MNSLSILLLMFDEVELLDFAGPYEVFSCANRMAQRERPGAPPPFELVTASPDGRAVTARAGLKLHADHALASAPATAWLLIPGGVVDGLLEDASVLAEVARRSASAQRVASVCTGAFVLAAAGVLRHADATTHWEDLEALGRRHPDLRLHADKRWVESGRIISSAGIAAGIDMSVHLVAQTLGPGLAQRTARQLDTSWHPQP